MAIYSRLEYLATLCTLISMADANYAQCEAKACEPGGGMILLPLGKDAENDWPRGVRIFLYLIGLFWAFAGVAIVADVFMSAIEKITSTKKFSKVTCQTTYVWNDTVANLTLMALGSSAPEILLGVIEIAGNDFYGGSLGPSTIVGSAAFNLFCISAVCVMAIPNDQKRVINDLGVFSITATFSVFAYLWLFFIVMGWTPEVVTIAESVITLLFFPVLVYIAYLADRGVFSSWFKVIEAKTRGRDPRDLTPQELATMEQDIYNDHPGEKISAERMAKYVQEKCKAGRSRATMRSGAIRHLTGGRRLSNVMKAPMRSMSKIMPTSDDDETSKKKCKGVVGFKSKLYTVMENVGIAVTLNVELRLRGVEKAPYPISVSYRTVDGTAKSSGTVEGGDKDFVRVNDATIVFYPGDTVRPIPMTILDDQVTEEEEEFYVELYNVQVRTPENDDLKAIGDTQLDFTAKLDKDLKIATVKIIDDDGPGFLKFQEETITVPSSNVDQLIPIVVQRRGGNHGEVSCAYKTEADTAVEGIDFEVLDGRLEFKQGESEGRFEVNVLKKGKYEQEEKFRIILSDAKGGVTFDNSTDGGSDTCILYVVIKADDDQMKFTDAVFRQLGLNYDKMQLGHHNWKDQFASAICPGAEEGEEPSTSDWLMHVFTIFWKVLFACIPPTDYCDGWVCFVISLAFIGGVTLFIGDLAALLGCVLELPDGVTAITFVALGTSLPDTFASKAAAVQEKYADASIGNITGSNSVNVFLGIGLSWTVGSIYWAIQDRDMEGGLPKWLKKYGGKVEDKVKVALDYPDGSHFAVRSGDLGFSVIIFCSCACICLGVFYLRRRLGLGELGGPSPQKQITGILFVTLWFTYVGLSTWKTFQSLSEDPCWNR